jgi:Mg2+ and Co2+ transporter CorA
MIKSIDVLGQNQGRLSQGVAQNSRQLSESRETSVSLEMGLSSLKQMIADVQNNTRNVNAKVVVVNDNQLKLQQGLGDKIREMMTNVEKIESSLSRLHDMVAVVQTNTEQVNTKVALLESTQKQVSRDIESRIQQVVKNIESLERLSSKVVTQPKVQENTVAEEAKPAASE